MFRVAEKPSGMQVFRGEATLIFLCHCSSSFICIYFCFWERCYSVSMFLLNARCPFSHRVVAGHIPAHLRICGRVR